MSYETYRHDEHSALDTDEQDIEIGLMYLMPRLEDAGLFVHYTYDRAMDGSSFDEIYTSHGAQVGVDKLFQLGGRSSIYAKASSRFSIDSPSPDFARRHEHRFISAYQFQVTDSLEAQLFYRARFYDFLSADREDWNHLVGLSASYWFTNTLGLTASFSWTTTNHPPMGRTDQAIDGGLALALDRPLLDDHENEYSIFRGGAVGLGASLVFLLGCTLRFRTWDLRWWGNDQEGHWRGVHPDRWSPDPSPQRPRYFPSGDGSDWRVTCHAGAVR